LPSAVEVHLHHSTERVPQFVRTHIEEHLRLTPVLLGVGGTLLDVLAQTDISHQKEVEASHVKVVEQRAADAEENRRQFLERCRNDLGILPLQTQRISLCTVREEVHGLTTPHDEMVENLEAIESIQICASHQTRIADGERRPALHAILSSPMLSLETFRMSATRWKLVSRRLENGSA
jgi:hypothetical protein